MRFPTFHRPSSSSDMDASIEEKEACNHRKNVPSEVLPLPPLQYTREPEHDNDPEDLISIMTTMQQKELDKYNPLQRFEYPLSSNAPLPQDNDNFNRKKTLIVDDECRTRMLEWSLKVSEEVLYSSPIRYFYLSLSLRLPILLYQRQTQ